MSRSLLDMRQVVTLAREARRPPAPGRPIHVSGPRASVLVDALAADGRPGLVRVGSGEGAAVLVCILDGPPTEADLAALRRATRALVPGLVVQTGRWEGRVPYVGAADVVETTDGTFPVDRIARAIAGAAPDDAEELAAALPVLAGPVRAACIARAAATAALVAGTPVGGNAHLPVIAAAQTRMLGGLRRTQGADLSAAAPQDLAVAVGPEVALPLAAGLAARALVRRVPRGGAPLRAGVAAGVTIGLGVLASRLAGRLPGA